jgi:hypothetical protein
VPKMCQSHTWLTEAGLAEVDPNSRAITVKAGVFSPAAES